MGNYNPSMVGPKDREHDEATGRYEEMYPREDFLEAISERDGMAGTTEVAESVGCRRETAYKKLRRMEDEGLVESRMIGNSLAWSVANGEGVES